MIGLTSNRMNTKNI